MAEKRRRSAGESAEERATHARQKAEKDVGLLDNPDVEDEPSEIRHTAYFVGVMLGGLVLNLLVMVIVSSGQ
jgi:hypothetical protein